MGDGQGQEPTRSSRARLDLTEQSEGGSDIPPRGTRSNCLWIQWRIGSTAGLSGTGQCPSRDRETYVNSMESISSRITHLGKQVVPPAWLDRFHHPRKIPTLRKWPRVGMSALSP
jgi:hypothetical protein